MDLKKLIRESLNNHSNKSLILKGRAVVSELLQYHIDNGLTLTNNIFGTYSESYFDLVNEVRELWEDGLIKLNEGDQLMVESDLGRKVMVNGKLIYLDAPFLYEDENDEEVLKESKHRGNDVKLNNFAVYVKSKSGGVKKVSFDNPNLRVENRNEETEKLFRVRHKCDQKKDRTTAGYWRCSIGRYSKQLGLSSSNS
jgi:hypothetical protein